MPKEACGPGGLLLESQRIDVCGREDLSAADKMAGGGGPEGSQTVQGLDFEGEVNKGLWLSGALCEECGRSKDDVDSTSDWT